MAIYTNKKYGKAIIAIYNEFGLRPFTSLEIREKCKITDVSLTPLMRWMHVNGLIEPVTQFNDNGARRYVKKDKYRKWQFRPCEKVIRKIYTTCIEQEEDIGETV